jgi:hypothetical protein
MINEKLSVGLLLGVALVSTPAAAHEARKLSIGVHAAVEHDTNVARSSEAQAALRGVTQADTYFTPSLSIDYTAPIGRQSVFLSGTAGYAFYDKNKDLNRERVDLLGGGVVGLGPCAVTPTGQYARGIRQIDDSVLESDVRNVQENKRVNLGVACSRPTGLGVTLSAGKSWTDNSEAILFDSDYETTSFSGGVTYTRPALGKLTAFGSYGKTEYPNRLLSSGYELNSYGLSLERQLGARIQGEATVAYTLVDQLTPIPGADDSTYGSTTYSGAVSFRASNRLMLQASFGRNIKPSSGLDQSYDKATDYGVSADYDLGTRFKFSLGARHVERDSEGALIVLPFALTSSKTTNVFGSVRYKQSERLSFTLRASREERTTNVPQFDYTSNRFGISADATF